MEIFRFATLLSLLTCSVYAQQGWWMTEPLRLVQTNLRETDSSLDPVKLARELEDFPANTLLFSVGGIVAHYPTRVEFHYPSEFLPEGEDLVGTMLREAHQRRIRVIGRFDFSRARRLVYESHPDWFFRNADGEPVFDHNGLYSSCINGGYYHEKAVEVLTEALERYELDGLFFNWFGNIRTDYFGNDIGLCHCAECIRRFREQYGREIPEEPDAEYARFMFDSSREVARIFRDLIHRKRPNALFMTYIQEYTDGIVSEADFYKWRALPQWLYSSSENVNRALNTRPDKMSFNLVMPYQEMRYRFASTSGPGLRALLYQNIAHGAFPAFVVLGTLQQPDLSAQNAVRQVFKWHSEHEDLLQGQTSAARVVLYAEQGPGWHSGSRDHRGFFRLLSELHVPFRVTDRLRGLSPENTDLVIVPNGATPPELEPYVEQGGSVLIAGTTHPGLGFPEMKKLWRGARSSYMRIEKEELFPSLSGVEVVFHEGDYLELSPEGDSPVTFVPPSTFGPPDKVSAMTVETSMPGLLFKESGRGRIAYIPWSIGRLYYLHSNDKHRGFLSDILQNLGGNNQLQTDAHPLVEVTVMEKAGEDQTLLHFINLLGHSGTGFFEAPEIRGIRVKLKGEFRRAEALKLGRELPVMRSGGYVNLTLPRLSEYEVVVLTLTE